MARYEYRCRVCDERFELRRPMSEADEPATCPFGHGDTRRMLSVFAAVGSGAGAAGSGGPTSSAGGGCGAGCACAPG